jgi:hypothetical protein
MKESTWEISAQMHAKWIFPHYHWKDEDLVSMFKWYEDIWESWSLRLTTVNIWNLIHTQNWGHTVRTSKKKNQWKLLSSAASQSIDLMAFEKFKMICCESFIGLSFLHKIWYSCEFILVLCLHFPLLFCMFYPLLE